MKRFVSILILIALVFELCGCGAAPTQETPAPAVEKSVESAVPESVETTPSPEELQREADYAAALAALEEEDYAGAYRLFSALADYRDAKEYLARFRVLSNVRLSSETLVSTDGEPLFSVRMEYAYDEAGRAVEISREYEVRGKFKTTSADVMIRLYVEPWINQSLPFGDFEQHFAGGGKYSQLYRLSYDDEGLREAEMDRTAEGVSEAKAESIHYRYDFVRAPRDGQGNITAKGYLWQQFDTVLTFCLEGSAGMGIVGGKKGWLQFLIPSEPYDVIGIEWGGTYPHDYEYYGGEKGKPFSGKAAGYLLVDPSGKPLTELTYDFPGRGYAFMWFRTFSYDEEGRLVRLTWGGNGNLLDKSGLDQYVEYEISYDENGLLREMNCIPGKQASKIMPGYMKYPEITLYYDYDENGNNTRIYGDDGVGCVFEMSAVYGDLYFYTPAGTG